MEFCRQWRSSFPEDPQRKSASCLRLKKRTPFYHRWPHWRRQLWPKRYSRNRRIVPQKQTPPTHARMGAPGVLGDVRFRSARVPWTDCDIVTSGSTVSVRQLVTDAAQLRNCAVKPLRGRSRQAVSLHIPANQTSERVKLLGLPRQFFKSRNCDGGAISLR